MTYAKERYFKATVALSYAEAGFEKSVREASKLLAECDIDCVPEILEQLRLEHELLKDVKEDLKRAERYLKESEAFNCGS